MGKYNYSFISPVNMDTDVVPTIMEGMDNAVAVVESEKLSALSTVIICIENGKWKARTFSTTEVCLDCEERKAKIEKNLEFVNSWLGHSKDDPCKLLLRWIKVVNTLMKDETEGTVFYPAEVNRVTSETTNYLISKGYSVNEACGA